MAAEYKTEMIRQIRRKLVGSLSFPLVMCNGLRCVKVGLCQGACKGGGL